LQCRAAGGARKAGHTAPEVGQEGKEKEEEEEEAEEAPEMERIEIQTSVGIRLSSETREGPLHGATACLTLHDHTCRRTAPYCLAPAWPMHRARAVEWRRKGKGKGRGGKKREGRQRMQRDVDERASEVWHAENRAHEGLPDTGDPGL